MRLLDDAYVDAAANAFTRRVCNTDQFLRAASVFIYVSVKKEPETRLIIKNALGSGKKVYVPKCLPDRTMKAVQIDRSTFFRPNAFSIPEPVAYTEQADARSLDLCVIPCAAASPDGGRLGQGGGYYDRFLKEADTFKLCLCYEINLLDRVPVEPHDVPINAIITEKRTVACR